MNRSSTMKNLAFMSMVFGLSFPLMAMYGAGSLNGPGVFNAMGYGGCLLALAVMTWIASDSGARQARPVVSGTLVADTVGFLAALVRQVSRSGRTANCMGECAHSSFSFLPSCSVISGSRRNRAAGRLRSLPLEHRGST